VGASVLCRALVLAVVVSAVAWNDASAQPSDRTIVKTIQCEAGKVGERLVAEGIPANLKVIVSWTSTKTRDGSAGAGIKFFSWGVSGDLSRQDIGEQKSESLLFNLHPKNLDVCRGYQVEIIKEGVGVYDCLVDQKLASLQVAVEEGSGSTGCRKQVTISKKAKGDARLNVWGTDIGPSASLSDTFVYNFVIAAPAPVKK
jgi:hypothetical protein